jgi:hypothetical protein
MLYDADSVELDPKRVSCPVMFNISMTFEHDLIAKMEGLRVQGAGVNWDVRKARDHTKVGTIRLENFKQNRLFLRSTNTWRASSEEYLDILPSMQLCEGTP